MKYISKNRFCDFIIHDADFIFDKRTDKDLVVSAKHLNIIKTAEQNPYDVDMEIKCAIITFKNYSILSLVDVVDVSKKTIYEGKEAEDKIIDELKNCAWAKSIEEKENSVYSIDFCGKKILYFIADIQCESVTIEWDEYNGEAWYEKRRKNQCR